MTRTRSVRIAILALALFGLAVQTGSRAQDNAAGQIGAGSLSIEAVQAHITGLEQLQQAGDLSQEDTTRLQLYHGALASLQAAEQSAQLSREFDNEESQAPVELEAVRAELAETPAELSPQAPPGATLSTLEDALAAAEIDLSTARDRLREIETELEHRATRRTEILQQSAAYQQDLDEVVGQLGTLPLADESQALTAARATKLRADERAITQSLDLAQQERENYDARSELIPLRRERWVRRIAQLEKLTAAWQVLVDDARTEDIRRKREEADRATMLAHPLVKDIAQENLKLADRRDVLRPRIEAVQQELTDLSPDPDTLQKQLRRLEQKVSVVGLTSGVGMLLRKNRAGLPDVRVLVNGIRERTMAMATLEFERLDLEDDRETLYAGKERMIQEFLAELDPTLPDVERTAIETEVRDLLGLKREYLDSLDVDLTTYFDRLAELNEKQQQVVVVTTELTRFIDQHILWIQSADRLQMSDLDDVAAALAWMFSPSDWARIGRGLVTNALSRWPVAIFTILVLAALVGARRRLRVWIRSVGGELSTPSDGTFGQTMAVAGCTLLTATVWPAVMWSLGTWLFTAHIEGGTDLALATGIALQRFASFVMVLMMAYEACQPHGLGEAHFGWRPRNVRVARHQIGWLTVVIAGFGLPVSMVNHQDNHAFETSLGRLAFIGAVVGLAVYLHGLLTPKTGILRDYLSTHRGSWANRLRYIWYPAAVMIPLSLAVASFIGFHYTALQICSEVLDTMAFVVVIVLLYGLARRWIYFGRRTLAQEQARALREAYEQRAAKGEATTGEAPPPDAAPIDISAISGQAVQLLRGAVLFSVLIGLFAIWANTFPAIGFLNRVELWQGSIVAAGDTTPVMITLEDLLWAIVLMVVTMIVAKNIPGLLEITVLQHLPLERGGQFAISTIVRYVITVVGVVVAFNEIGVTWVKVQWLAAALTVGLGFGLNEIFGNFMSGLIILFERPIRVGDTVTVGEISGTITKIRIRATTLVDWDRKELVIPNKIFVTETVVNWTLSDQILRLVFPVVIEHGSDTELAERVLLEIAGEHPIVLNDPAPSTMFKKIGDNGLEIDLRLFIPHIDHFVRVKDEIHGAIHTAFQKQGIRFFAFSHRDIDVRSMSGIVPA